MAHSEPKITLMVYQALPIGLIALIPTIYLWSTPTLADFILLLLVGVISSLAQYVGISAYKWAPANIIVNIEYVKIIYSIIIGLVVFSELPDRWSIIGALTIFASALLPMLWAYRCQHSNNRSRC